MFNWLRCAYPLPIPAVQSCVFQTKSFDPCLMDAYTVRADGTLWHTLYDIEDRSDPTATGLAALAGIMTRVNEREEACLDFSGEVAFHTDYGRRNPQGWGEGWVEFLAEFKSGRLAGLEVVEHKEPPEVVAQRGADALNLALPLVAEPSKGRRL